MMAEYRVSGLTIIQAAEDATGWRPEELPAMNTARTTTGVNLRSGPAGKMPIVAVLKPNVQIVRLGVEEGGWVAVAACGWVSKELLK